MSMGVQDIVGVQSSQSEVKLALAITQGHKNARKNGNKGSALQTLYRLRVVWAVPLITAALSQLRDSSDVEEAGQCTKSEQENP